MSRADRCFDCTGASGARVRPARKRYKTEKTRATYQFSAMLDLRSVSTSFPTSFVRLGCSHTLGSPGLPSFLVSFWMVGKRKQKTGQRRNHRAAEIRSCVSLEIIQFGWAQMTPHCHGHMGFPIWWGAPAPPRSPHSSWGTAPHHPPP